MADPAEPLRVTRALSLAPEEFEWRFTGSGGPGGQHANTSNTRVELRFDITRSQSLSERQRERLVAKLGSVVRVVVSDERSQLRNRERALDRLAERLAQALYEQPPRRATRPGTGAKERRLQAKHEHAETKRERRRPSGDD
jgi:ribosome-associated protein